MLKPYDDHGRLEDPALSECGHALQRREGRVRARERRRQHPKGHQEHRGHHGRLAAEDVGQGPEGDGAEQDAGEEQALDQGGLKKKEEVELFIQFAGQ